MAVTYTAQQVLAKVEQICACSVVEGMQYLNEAHVYIQSQLHLVPDQTYLFTLTAGTQEYALPDGVIAIWDASYWSGGYVQGGTNFKPLKATNVDTLFEDYGPNWDLRPNSQPWCYYERGGNVGFYPNPDTTNAQVRIVYTPASVLTPTSTLPTNIPSCEAWVWFVAEKIMARQDFQKAMAFREKFEFEMERLRKYILGRTGRDRSRISFRIKRIRRA